MTKNGDACADEMSEYADSLGVLLCPLKFAIFAHSVPCPYAALGSRVDCPSDACLEWFWFGGENALWFGGEKAPWFGGEKAP